MNNLYEEQPAITKRLLAQLKEEVVSGRSTDGPTSNNDVNSIVLWKSGEVDETRKKKSK